jgi:hypothetical protein
MDIGFLYHEDPRQHVNVPQNHLVRCGISLWYIVQSFNLAFVFATLQIIFCGGLVVSVLGRQKFRLKVDVIHLFFPTHVMPSTAFSSTSSPTAVGHEEIASFRTPARISPFVTTARWYIKV